jgi:hypothetical protein
MQEDLDVRTRGRARGGKQARERSTTETQSKGKKKQEKKLRGAVCMRGLVENASPFRPGVRQIFQGADAADEKSLFASFSSEKEDA